MKYVEKNLRINEHVVAKAKVSWTVMAMVVVRAIIFMLIGLALWKALQDPSNLNDAGELTLNLNYSRFIPAQTAEPVGVKEEPKTELIVHSRGDSETNTVPEISLPGEKTAEPTQVSYTVKVNPTIFLAVWGSLAVCYIVYKALSISAVELAVTEKKIVGKTGIINSRSTDAFLEKIDYFAIKESLAGRLFNYATIEIGTTSSKVRFPYIEYASYFKNTVMDCIDRKKYNDMVTQAKLITEPKPDNRPAK
ncbi:MAG: PH domain-containing protein [Lachnospiraceae bacterium]|nr:PH domain-containing protein [Lachnospiraceae bacterium]